MISVNSRRKMFYLLSLDELMPGTSQNLPRKGLSKPLVNVNDFNFHFHTFLEKKMPLSYLVTCIYSKSSFSFPAFIHCIFLSERGCHDPYCHTKNISVQVQLPETKSTKPTCSLNKKRFITNKQKNKCQLAIPGVGTHI